MTVDELMMRFPEIPREFAGEPVLARFAEAFDPLLREAREPGPCATHHDAANHYYLKLVGPLSIYRFGLATREATLGELEALLDRQAADPEAFAAGLLPPDTAGRERRRCD